MDRLQTVHRFISIYVDEPFHCASQWVKVIFNFAAARASVFHKHILLDVTPVYLVSTGLWDSLLEGRIKFQKVVCLINQLPQPDTWQEFTEVGADNFQEETVSGM